MLKITPVFWISLLNLVLYITGDELEDSRGLRIILKGACSDYFEYRALGGFLSGRLGLPHMEIGDTVKLTFMVIFFGQILLISHKKLNINEGSPGILLPYGSSEGIINKLQKKQPILYRVDFPLTFFMPALLNISINGNELCNTNIKPIFFLRDVLTLEHTLDIKNDSMQVYTKNIQMLHFAKTSTCGLVDREINVYGGTPLVFGGQLLIRGEHPWLAAIYKKDNGGISFICGGSLVTSKIILSAAHCFEILSLTAENITAMLGRHNLTNSMEDGYTTRAIERIILHPDYKSRPVLSDADLALLVMEEHVSFTKFIKPICLWNEPADESRIVNQTGVVVGWGSDEDGNSVITPKKVDAKIVSAEECLRSSVALSFLTSPRTLCAGKRDGSGPCTGDSGGGLVLQRNGIWLLRGIVSLGFTDQGRCDLQEYTVYCDVAKHMSWLKNHIKQQEPVIGSLKDICGRSNTEARIEHPWLAPLYKHFLTGEIFECTGTIVSTRSILMPASCFRRFPINHIRVYYGRYDLSNFNEKGVVSREVDSMLYQSDLKLTDHVVQNHNIALLQMKDPVGYTECVKPICLCSEPFDWSQTVGQSVTMSGWAMSDVRKEISLVPKSMEVNIASLEQCQALGHNVSTTSNILCIPRDGNLTGRVLMMKRIGRWLFLGGCSYFHESDNFCLLVYADIVEQMSWIQRNMLE